MTAVEAPPPEEDGPDEGSHQQLLYQIDIELDNHRKLVVKVHEGQLLTECLLRLQEEENLTRESVRQIQDMIQLQLASQQ